MKNANFAAKKVAIIRFPGTNCERDMDFVYTALGAQTKIIWHTDRALPSCDLVVLAGGFSYGDYLRSGAIAALANIMESVRDFGAANGRILGICNGFQILCEAHLLPGALKRNSGLNFISKSVELKIASNNNAFLRGYEVGSTIRLPIAHADGNYFCDPATLESLRRNEQILLTYATDINGSVEQIAGITNESKNIFGLMPHPERAFDLDSGDGQKMLANLLV